MKAVRQQVVVDLLINHRSLVTEALALQLSASKEIIRHDLSEPQIQGRVSRSHGRTKIIYQKSQDSGGPFHIRLRSHYAHKTDIAHEALAWTEESMVTTLDASSTCWYLARQLPDISIHAFTSSQPICRELAKHEHIQLTSSDGRLERKYGCYANPSFISQLKPLKIDLLIFPCEGIDSDGVLWDSSATSVDFKSTLPKRASQFLLLIDKSKFNRSGEVRIGYLDDMTYIVSDTQLIETIRAEQGDYATIRPGLQPYRSSRRPPTTTHRRRM